MLSSAPNGPRAVALNIEIMRPFERVLQLAVTPARLARLSAEIEHKTEQLGFEHENSSRNSRKQLKQVFDALQELMTPPDPPKRPMGFVTTQDRKKGKGWSDPSTQPQKHQGPPSAGLGH